MRALVLSMVLALFSVPAFAASEDMPRVSVRLAVSAELMAGPQAGFLSETIDAIRRKLEPRSGLELSILAEELLREAVERHRVEGFIASSGLYRKTLLSGSRDIAVAAVDGAEDGSRVEGGLFLKRLDGEPVDLGSARTAVCGQPTFTERAAMEGEILKAAGQRRKGLFDGPALTMEEGIERLRTSRIDVVLLPACALERFSRESGADTSDLTVLSPKLDGSVACWHSTELFPGITMAATPSLPARFYKSIVEALLSVSTEDPSNAWVFAADFSRLDRVLRLLDEDSWAGFREPDWRRFLRRFRPVFLGVLGIVLLAVALNVLLSFLVRRKTVELRDALEGEKRARRLAVQFSDRLEKMRRLQTIGQMASLFAHELGQPLNAAGCYARGLRKALERGRTDRIPRGISGIEREIDRARSIIDKVRDYVRSNRARQWMIDLEKTVGEAIISFRTTSDGDIPIELSAPKSAPMRVMGDALEMELVVVNLLRNAAQAQGAVEHPFIRVEILAGAETCCIAVTDNGPPLTKEALENIRFVGESTRPSGLGLGLSITRDLVEANHGSIRFSLSETQSLRVEVRLPLVQSTQGEASS